jgi:glycosyltransferase involved in cell wall biosynthesis
MNVLQVAPYSAFPPEGGGQHRIHGLMKAHGSSDSVTRFATAKLSQSSGKTVIGPRYREYRETSYAYSVLSFIAGKADISLVFASQFLRITNPEPLRKLAAQADVIVVEFPWQLPYVKSICPPEVPIVYSSHNFECEEYAFLTNSRLTKPIYYATVRAERRAVHLADLVVVTTKRDEMHYRKAFDAEGPFHIAPNAATISAVQSEHREKRRNNDGEHIALFIGSSHSPNIDAVDRILSVARDDRIRDRPIRFRIIGTVCDAYDGAPPENVEFLGFVDDLEPQYREADIGLNPVFTGGGSNVKVPEYFAHGLAVVTTEYGLRGVPARPGYHCVVGRDGSFTEVLLDLLETDDATIERIGYRAQKFVLEQLNWESISTDLFDRIRELTT